MSKKEEEYKKEIQELKESMNMKGKNSICDEKTYQRNRYIYFISMITVVIGVILLIIENVIYDWEHMTTINIYSIMIVGFLGGGIIFFLVIYYFTMRPCNEQV